MDLGAMLAGKRVLVTGASSGLGENSLGWLLVARPR